MAFPVKTPKPPYYAVIFAAIRRHPSADSDESYSSTLARMLELGQARPGFLGIESVTAGTAAEGAAGPNSITISYWADEESIAGWKKDMEHAAAQRKGRAEWYDKFEVRVCKVERRYGFERKGDTEGAAAQL